MARIFRLLFAFALALVLFAAAVAASQAGCGTYLPSMSKPRDFARIVPPRPLPKPEVTTRGRVVMVRLPYRAKDGRGWTAVAQPAEMGPFAFSKLRSETLRGPRGTDLAVFTYVASGPGTGALKFDLEPYGRGPAALGPALHYETTVSVR